MSAPRNTPRGGRYAPLFAPARMLPRREPWIDDDRAADAKLATEEAREVYDEYDAKPGRGGHEW